MWSTVDLHVVVWNVIIQLYKYMHAYMCTYVYLYEISCCICLEVELLDCIIKVVPKQLYQSCFRQESSNCCTSLSVFDVIFLITVSIIGAVV